MNMLLPDIAETTRIITCTIEGILEPEDLQVLVSAAIGDTTEGQLPASREVDDPADLKRIRERHHSVARLIAGGVSQRLVASISNYTESYLSVLLNNPAMQELIEHYRIQHGNAAEVIAEKLRTVGTKALEKLSDKLDADEVQDVNELTGIAKLGLDRSGHGPSSTQHVVSKTHLIDHARIAELNARAKAGSKEFIVPVHEVRAALVLEHVPQPAAEDQGDADD